MSSTGKEQVNSGRNKLNGAIYNETNVQVWTMEQVTFIRMRLRQMNERKSNEMDEKAVVMKCSKSFARFDCPEKIRPTFAYIQA
jgi:hypothetical protein